MSAQGFYILDAMGVPEFLVKLHYDLYYSLTLKLVNRFLNHSLFPAPLTPNITDKQSTYTVLYMMMMRPQRCFFWWWWQTFFWLCRMLMRQLFALFLCLPSICCHPPERSHPWKWQGDDNLCEIFYYSNPKCMHHHLCESFLLLPPFLIYVYV